MVTPPRTPNAKQAPESPDQSTGLVTPGPPSLLTPAKTPNSTTKFDLDAILSLPTSPDTTGVPEQDIFLSQDADANPAATPSPIAQLPPAVAQILSKPLHHNTEIITQLLQLPVVREATLRSGKVFKHNRKRAMAEEAYLAQERGTKEENTCEQCRKNRGPFQQCVILDDLLAYTCANCHYAGRDDCTLLQEYELAEAMEMAQSNDPPELPGMARPNNYGGKIDPGAGFGTDDESTAEKKKKTKAPRRLEEGLLTTIPLGQQFDLATAAVAPLVAIALSADVEDVGRLFVQQITAYSKFTRAQRDVERASLTLALAALDQANALDLLRPSVEVSGPSATATAATQTTTPSNRKGKKEKKDVKGKGKEVVDRGDNVTDVKAKAKEEESEEETIELKLGIDTIEEEAEEEEEDVADAKGEEETIESKLKMDTAEEDTADSQEQEQEMLESNKRAAEEDLDEDVEGPYSKRQR